MKTIHFLFCGISLLVSFSAVAENTVLSVKSDVARKNSGLVERNFDRYGKQKSILQLERQFKLNGSLMNSDRHALQARLDRVSQGIRNFNGSASFGTAGSVNVETQVHQVSDNPKLYMNK